MNQTLELGGEAQKRMDLCSIGLLLCGAPLYPRGVLSQRDRRREEEKEEGEKEGESNNQLKEI